ncbi:MAG TPA: hypothetical protein VFR70_02630, partial [Flavobacterium sp.]|nr:hypothetical protein [Flavobacterium sp.]
ASVPIVSLFRTASGDASKTSTALGTRFTDTLAFSDVYSLVNSAVNASSETIIGNTPSQGNASVSIGGVIVPVAPRQAVPFGYQVCSRIYKSRSEPRNAIDYVTFDMILDLPDSTWIIIGVQTAVTQNAVTTASSVFNPLRIGNSVRLNSLYTQGLLYSAFSSGIADLAVTITFSNGAVKKFSSGFWNTISCLSGILSPVKDAPVLTPDPGSAGPSNPVKAEDNFIPSGFGVKRLGIADYKKVEQTVQGYVEGDVAHIENIMAREYKDKATRRLRRSENTETNSSESEREKLSDTTTADRFEMQAETAKILQEGKDLSAGASFNADFGRFNLATNVNMATHSSKEESNRQAVTQAKEVTERAMERIVAKVKQERIEKIVEEFEENNKHGFDNTKGDKHVVGVYRWVDKVYKNQVLNYGKRLMFEFMVPEPAKLHLLGMSENKGLTSLVKPADPREFEDPAGAAILLNLKDYSKVNENTAKYWGGMFNADLAPMPEQTIYIGKSFYYQAKEIASNAYERAAESAELDIPEGYKATMAAAASRDTNDYLPGPYTRAQVLVGNKVMSETFSSINSFQNKIPVSYSQLGFLASSANISIQCELTAEAKIKWQQETFKAIIKAYKEALAAYEQKLAAENASGTKIKGENPGFYRQIENMILRKNCISYIIDQNEAAGRTYGKNMFKPLAPGSDRKFTNHEVNVGPALDDYAAFSKFIEQAFEWEIMSYNFYPYYWGAKEDWPMLYQYDNNDPLFRSFMQAGMARVVVTVRPGFEEAVNYYMQTGQIWNGGEVPIIEDKLFMAIADELRQPEGQKIGKAWPTRLPTALTVLQAQAIGLNVTKALPFDENLSDFENPESVPQSAGLGFSEAQLGISQKARVVGKIRGNQNKEAKIMLKNLDGTTHDLTYCDARGNWELNDIPAAKYQLLLDADNDFPAPQFQVIQGSKEHMIELSGGQTLEVNLTLNSIPGQTP